MSFCLSETCSTLSPPRRHWSDRSRRRAGVDRFRLALGPGTGAQGPRDAGSDFRGERYQCIM